MNLRPQRYDLIAFDWDGTLFDSTAIITRSIQMAVRDVGGTVPSDREASYVIGMALSQALAHAAPDVPPEKYPELGARYRHHYLAHQNDLSLFDGVLPLLDDLRARHHWLAVATGKSRRGLNDAAIASLDLVRRYGDDWERPLRYSRAGRELIKLGLQDDLLDAARLDAYPVLAHFHERRVTLAPVPV